MTHPADPGLFAETSPPEPGTGSPTDRTTDHTERRTNLLPATTPGVLNSPRLLIRASAGTGKTFQLSSRYISILRFASPDRILASTFTKKAAGEILERILIRLARAATNKDKFKELANSLDGPPLTLRECLTLLSSLTRQLHRVRISTLDGFFARIATAFALELGLPIGWRMLDELEATSAQHAAITALLTEGSLQELKQLVELLDKGNSGASIHAMIAKKVETFYSLYRHTSATAWDRFPEVHFLNADERHRLVDALAAVPLDDKRMTTARDKDCEKIRTEDWEGLKSAGLLCKLLEGNTFFNKKPIPPQAITLYNQLREHLRAAIITPWAQQTKATYDLLQHFHGHYREQKRNLRGLQFDDVTYALAGHLQEHHPDAVAYRMDGGIEHLLLDEFQDTSPMQWNVLRPFAQDTCRVAGGSFFCVGDVKQAIYGWRGGEAAIFRAIENQLPDLEPTELNHSRRSSQVIMQTVNQAFHGMRRHNGFDGESNVVYQWSNAFPQHATARDIPGYASLRTIPIPEDVPADNKEERDEIHFPYIAKYVQDLLSQNPHHTIGILVRSNASIGRIIYELNKLGVPASEEGGNPVTDSAAVQLVLSLLQLADHPGDTIARFHVAKSRWGQTLNFTDNRNDQQATLLAERVRRQLIQQGYGAVVHRWLQELAPDCNARELRRLRQLEALADTYDLRLTLRTRDFIDFVHSQRVQEPQAALVRVMTIHQSKGLEFDTVVLPELDKPLAQTPEYYTLTAEELAPPNFVALRRDRQSFELLPDELQPAYDAGWSRQYEENLCVLYVAMTRAVHALHMLIAPRTKKSAEQSLPKTAAGLLRAGLAPEAAPEPDTVLFCTGDPHWWLDPRMPVVAAPHPSTETAAPIQIQLASIPPARQRQLTRITPSQEEGHRVVRLSHVLRFQTAAALDRGTLFHAWFEQIQWVDEALPSNDTLRNIGQRLGAQHLNIDRCLTQFHTMLKAPSIAWALSRRSYQAGAALPFAPHIQAELAAGPVELKVVTERRFSVQVDDQLISGSIDRLVLISRNWQLLAADILDFKTDTLPTDPTALQDRIDFYRGQLQSYVRAVAQLHKLDTSRISARLVLLSAGRVENCSTSGGAQ